jgi:hypothetical protein
MLITSLLSLLWMREAFAGSPFSGFVEEGYHLNSYLHLAIGILGHRVVHLSRMEEGHTLHPQQPGDIWELLIPFAMVLSIRLASGTLGCCWCSSMRLFASGLGSENRRSW